MATAASLMQRYTEYNDRLKAQGIKLIAFQCPDCKQSIETQPAPEGDIWDTLSNCPHCNAMFMKITKGHKAYGLIPDAQSKAQAQTIVNQASSNIVLKQPQ